MSNKVEDKLKQLQEDKKKDNKRLSITLVLVIITIIIILLLLRCCSKKEDVPKQELPMDESQGAYKEQEYIDHSQNIVMPGWGSFTIPKDTVDINMGIDLFNPESNLWYKCPDCDYQLDDNYKCTNEECGHQHSKETAIEDCYYMSFGLYLEDNDELLYQSNLVSPGNHLQSITLTKSLSEGEYDAYVFIQPYKSDKATACNNGKVKIKLYAK